MLPTVCTPGLTPETWEGRREELLELFRRYEYGRRPDLPYRVESRLVQSRQESGTIRETHLVTVSTERGSVELELALVLPAGTGRVPAVLMISNHDRVAPPQRGFPVELMQNMLAGAPAWWREETMAMFAGMEKAATAEPNLLDISRNEGKGYWSEDAILASGRAAAAFYASQAQPDDPERFPSCLTALFQDPAAPRAADNWGTLGVWAFAASCMIDVLSNHPRIDAGRLSVAGHSRGGKAALWCAAQDERVRGVLVNNSGCSGAAVSRGKHGEVVASITAGMSYWFCPNYSRFAWREEEMPFDQHLLVAAVAPRLCYITSGTEDSWSDPDAEWLGARAGSEAWRLFGWEALPQEPPEPGTALAEGPVGYHRRPGGHDLTAWDWKLFLTFLDRQGG